MTALPESPWVRCPGCDQLKEWVPARKGGEWYTRTRRRSVGEDGIVEETVEFNRSPYCRRCTIRQNVEARVARRYLKRLSAICAKRSTTGEGVGGVCDVCGGPIDQLEVVSANPTVFACCGCAEMLRLGRSWVAGAQVALLQSREGQVVGRRKRSPLVPVDEMEARVAVVIGWMDQHDWATAPYGTR